MPCQLTLAGHFFCKVPKLRNGDNSSLEKSNLGVSVRLVLCICCRPRPFQSLAISYKPQRVIPSVFSPGVAKV
jgi:hypothetical protein